MAELENNKTTPSENNEKAKKPALSPLVRNAIISVVIALVAIIVVLCIPEPEDEEKHESFDIQAICELATLKCRYHNVAYMSEKTGLFGLGHKEVWLEFDGFVTIGIDVDDVYISDPSEDGVVQVYLPPSKMLSSTIDKSTIKKPVENNTLFVSITAEEEIALVEAAQKETENDAQFNTRIYKEADLNAKVLFEQYIINIGKLTGKTYTVEWLNAAPSADEAVQ